VFHRGLFDQSYNGFVKLSWAGPAVSEALAILAEFEDNGRLGQLAGSRESRAFIPFADSAWRLL
jgi:hypothetical protein